MKNLSHQIISVLLSFVLLFSSATPIWTAPRQGKIKENNKNQGVTNAGPSCPNNTPDADLITDMLNNTDSQNLWGDAKNVSKMVEYLDKNPQCLKKYPNKVRQGYRTTSAQCTTHHMHLDHYAPICKEAKAFVALLEKSGVKFYTQTWVTGDPDKAHSILLEEVTVTGKNPPSKEGGVNGQKVQALVGNAQKQNPTEVSADGKSSGQAGAGQPSRLLLNLTQEEFEKLCKEKPQELPKVFQKLSEKLRSAIESGEDISPLITLLAKDSSIIPEDTHYVPLQLIQMAFLMYAYSLKPNEAQKIMQHITNKKEFIRHAVASAVAEHAKYSVGQSGGQVLNESPVGHLQLNANQRALAVEVLRQSVAGYKADSMGKRLDILRLYRLDQREVANMATINYNSCPASHGTTVMMTVLAAGGSAGALDAAGVGVTVAGGGAAVGGSIALPVIITFAFGGAVVYSLNESFLQTYAAVFTTGLLSSLDGTSSSIPGGSSAPVQISQEQVCDGLVLSQTQSPAQEVQNDDVEKGGHRVLASAVGWSSSHAQIGASVHTSTNQPRIDCGDAGRTDPNADWGGKQWWRDRFPEGAGGANMRKRIPELRQEIKALGGDVTKQSSARVFITQGRAVRNQLSREAQMTLRELEEINKNVISRSNSFYNTAARGNSDAVFVKAVKSDGKWKPSVEISTETRGVSHVIGEVLAPELVNALKAALCGGLSDVSSKNLGGGKVLRFGSYDVNAPKPHMHYEEDKGTYECNNSVLFNAAWDVLVPAVCSM